MTTPAMSSYSCGPYEAPLLDVWSIDGHPFVDVDGRRWLFYNVRVTTTRYRGVVPGCGNLVDELVAPNAVRHTPTVEKDPGAIPALREVDECRPPRRERDAEVAEAHP